MPPEELVEHLSRASSLPPGVAARLVAEVVEYFSEPVESFVRRRHRQLQASGRANQEIFAQVQSELAERRFPAPPLSERQLRRIVYG
ncbi:MAG TPA: hypothetical protein VE990_04965 [Acidimicrobiales bacterium]|nr:hypothetical protein [Acidimicrobiales bacterium]